MHLYYSQWNVLNWSWKETDGGLIVLCTSLCHAVMWLRDKANELQSNRRAQEMGDYSLLAVARLTHKKHKHNFGSPSAFRLKDGHDMDMALQFGVKNKKGAPNKSSALEWCRRGRGLSQRTRGRQRWCEQAYTEWGEDMFVGIKYNASFCWVGIYICDFYLE